MDREFLVQMRQSDKYESVRNDEIFNLHLGSHGGPPVSIPCLLQDTSHIYWFHQDDVAIEAIQNQNWQYFVETLLCGCSQGENLISFNENYKKSKVITNALLNITICKQTYNRFYEQISSNFEMTINNLPADEKQEINHDLQNLNHNSRRKKFKPIY